VTSKADKWIQFKLLKREYCILKLRKYYPQYVKERGKTGEIDRWINL
jgi:hypothetical protein